MIVGESLRGRRLVGRFEGGAEIVAALVELAASRGVHAGEVRAVGVVAEPSVRLWNSEARSLGPPRPLEGIFTLVQLSGLLVERDGRPALEPLVVLARGGELHAGHLASARAISVEVVVEAFDDLALRREIDPLSGLARLVTVAPPAPLDRPAPPRFEAAASGHFVSERPTAAERTPPPVAAPAPAPTWAEVAAASTEPRSPGADDEDEDATEDPLRPGDLIDHPRFGRCRVERIEGDSEFAQVRLKNMRLIRLSLDVLQLVRDGSEEGQRRYRAVVAR